MRYVKFVQLYSGYLSLINSRFSLRQNLIAQTDKIIGQLLDSGGSISCDNGLTIMCDQDSLCSLADDNAVLALSS